MRQGNYVEFVPGKSSASGLTLTWTVRSLTGYNLGEVRWFAHWRRYAFFPFASVVFDADCLSDIAEFLQEGQKQRQRVRREAKA